VPPATGARAAAGFGVLLSAKVARGRYGLRLGFCGTEGQPLYT